MFIKEGENNSLHPGVITLKPGRRCWLSPFFIFVVCYVSVCLPTTQSHMLCHILLTTAADVHNVGMEDEREKLSKPQQIPLHNESVIFLHPHPRFCLFKKKKKEQDAHSKWRVHAQFGFEGQMGSLLVANVEPTKKKRSFRLI